MHLLFDNEQYSPHASSNVNYFLFVADVKCGLYEILKKSTKQLLHMDQVLSNKCSKTEPKRCWTCDVQVQDVDLLYHYIRYKSLS